MKPVLYFLAGYWLYIDAVDTIIRMAVDYGVKLGFEPGALIKALLLVQFIGFPAAVAYGWLADRFGKRRMIYVALIVYGARWEEHTSELQSIMRISYAVFCLKK